MTDREVIELVNNSLVEEFELNPSDLSPEADLFEDLGLDSLDIVDMVVLLENAFKIKIREEEAIREIRKLGEIHDFVLTKKRDMERIAS